MAEHNLYLVLLPLLGVVVGPAAAQQFNWLQASIANTVSTSLSGHGGGSDTIVAGMERGADNLRRTLLELNNTANNGLALAEEKVRDWYSTRLATIWRAPVAYAQWLNPDVPEDACPEDPALARLLKEVEREALACVADRVPRGIPDVHASVAAVQARIQQYVLTVRAQGEECDELVAMQAMMCKATRLAPLGGVLGALGGDAGRVGGQIGILVDGTARQCTMQAAQTREAQANAIAAAVGECIKALGGTQGTADTARLWWMEWTLRDPDEQDDARPEHLAADSMEADSEELLVVSRGRQLPHHHHYHHRSSSKAPPPPAFRSPTATAAAAAARGPPIRGAAVVGAHPPRRGPPPRP